MARPPDRRGTMTRIFITATITARGEVGIEDSRATPRRPDFIRRRSRVSSPRRHSGRPRALGYHPQGAGAPGYRPQGGTGTVPGYRPQGGASGTSQGGDIILKGGATPGYHPREVALRDIPREANSDHPQGGGTPGYHPQGGTSPKYKPAAPGGAKPKTPPPHEEHHQP